MTRKLPPRAPAHLSSGRRACSLTESKQTLIARRQPLLRRFASHAHPVNSPAAARHLYPDKFFHRCAARMVVKNRCALIKTACVRRCAIGEAAAVQVVAEFMAECAEERPKRGDLLANGRAHPHANQECRRIVISE